jgi:hypothetical protein
MLTQRVYLSFVLCTFILFSCGNKKLKNTAGSVAATISDTVQVQPDEVIDLSEYSNAFANNITQTFTAAPHKISVLTAKKGLRVTVNPVVLEKEDGTAVDEKINVSIIELTTSEDLFKSNAATVSNGRLLASGGSYFIGMECNGQKLRIKKGKNLQVEFPVIKENEMQLFYGQRDTANNMNWLDAGINLQQYKEDEILFTDSNNNNLTDNFPAFTLTAGGEAKVYRTLNEKVYYYEKMMTVKQLLDTINRHTAKIYADTVYMWPKEIAKLLPGQRVDTNYLYTVYGPPKQFILKTCKTLQEDKERKEMEKRKREDALEKWQPKNLAGQIQKYYNPSAITNLGWINCDRFYQNNPPAEIEIDLPITFNKGTIQYFVIFKNFNGLINGKLEFSEGENISLKNLPVGESITLIAFTKNNGQLFNCKEEFVIQKNKSVKLDFKNISAEEMNKIFGKNVRI